MIIEATKSLIEGRNLTLIDVREVFDEILSGLSDEIQTSAFLTAFKAKKATNDEFIGAILASKEALCLPKIGYNNQNSMQNLCLNKTSNILDVGFVQDIICSANDLPITRFNFEGKNFKTLKALNININKEKDLNSTEFENLNFTYFDILQSSPYCKYTNNIRRSGLFEEIFDTIFIFLNPLNSKNIFIGINNKEQVQQYANIALSLNYENSIVVGSDSFSFLSLEKESLVAEAWKNKIFTYVVTPDLLGFKEASNADLTCSSDEENGNYILDILKGKIKDFRYDFVVLNSALSLYITKKSDSIMDGINLAKKTIDSGLASEKLDQIKRFYQ